jgi:hypothetical protein
MLNLTNKMKIIKKSVNLTHHFNYAYDSRVSEDSSLNYHEVYNENNCKNME